MGTEKQFKAKYHNPAGHEFVTVYRRNVGVPGQDFDGAEISAAGWEDSKANRIVPMRLLSSWTPIEREERFRVELTGEGFQIRDTVTGDWHSDAVWSSRPRCMQACADLNEGLRIPKSHQADRTMIVAPIAEQG